MHEDTEDRTEQKLQQSGYSNPGLLLGGAFPQS